MCATYDREIGFDRMVAPFLVAGLRRNEKLFAFAPQGRGGLQEELESLPDGAETARALTTIDPASLFEERDGFDVDHMVEAMWAQQQESLDEGYEGMRIAADMSWAWGKVPPADLFAFEHRVNEIFRQNRAVAICAYDDRSMGKHHLARAVSSHPLMLEENPRRRSSPLRLTLSDQAPHLRMAGELDASNAARFARILMELMDSKGSIEIDLFELDFMDASSVRHLLRAARLHPDRSIALRSPSRGVAWALRMASPDLPDNLVLESAWA